MINLENMIDFTYKKFYNIFKNVYKKIYFKGGIRYGKDDRKHR